MTPLRLSLSVFVLACLAPLAGAQELGIRQDPGVSREAMWYAPTAEDWKKPVLIQWQRSWDDAVALQKETKRPILICVNMDGEIASEHYAGIRYRQPDIAKVYEPYICVIASVYRHNPRDHDEHGNRIPCPRFGGVTCGEHIAIEPIVFEKYLDGKRIAPRHIMVELDGKQTYDVYYAWDTASVFTAIGDGIKNRKDAPAVIVRGDKSLLEKVASPDNADRTAVEQAFAKGDTAERRALIEAAAARPEQSSPDLLRLAVFGFDSALGSKARMALSQSKSAGSVDLISEALQAQVPEAERSALVAALARIGETSPRARTLAVAHQGLAARSGAVDVDGWAKALGGGASYAAAADRRAVEQRLDSAEQGARSKPDDARARLEVAETTLTLALDPGDLAEPREGKYRQLMFEDARRAAQRAEELGGKSWRTSSVLAVCAYHLGDVAAAEALAEAAASGMPEDAQGRLAAEVLALFAHARQRANVKAVREKQQWPPQWLTDLNAAYSVLARHPFGTDQQVADHYDFLKFFNAAQTGRILEQGLQRFPESAKLHERLRGRALEEKGVLGLEQAYDALLQKEPLPKNLPWFAGYAELVAAEFHRKKGEVKEALSDYDRAIALYGRNVELHPESRASADHYVAMALGGKARIALEQGDLDGSLAAVIQSFERKPEAAATLDGLNISTVDTAKMLKVKLEQQQLPGKTAQLDAALAKLDPAMLELPAYERDAGPGQRPQGRRRGG